MLSPFATNVQVARCDVRLLIKQLRHQIPNHPDGDICFFFFFFFFALLLHFCFVLFFLLPRNNERLSFSRLEPLIIRFYRSLSNFQRRRNHEYFL